jgi:hypothetical protein
MTSTRRFLAVTRHVLSDITQSEHEQRLCLHLE